MALKEWRATIYWDIPRIDVNLLDVFCSFPSPDLLYQLCQADGITGILLVQMNSCTIGFSCDITEWLRRVQSPELDAEYEIFLV